MYKMRQQKIIKTFSLVFVLTVWLFFGLNNLSMAFSENGVSGSSTPGVCIKNEKGVVDCEPCCTMALKKLREAGKNVPSEAPKDKKKPVSTGAQQVGTK
ncbi:MAG: hypothetical protein HQK53_02885 [Oligoflexia bacterium]|nr:hypothetical protein [Oligoflexia bacterium]